MDNYRAPKRHCLSVSRVSTRLLLSFLAILTTPPVGAAWTDGWAEAGNQAPLLPILPQPEIPRQGQLHSREHTFTLRHIYHHGTHQYPQLHRRRDVDASKKVWASGGDVDDERELRSFPARSSSMNIQRLSDRRIVTVNPLLSIARKNGIPPVLPSSAWTLDEVLGPDVKDKETVLNLAIMTGNAYNQGPGIGDWENVTSGPDYDSSFGWEGDGLRGHVFADEDNSTVIVALKGTSPALFDGAETTGNDKLNDNLFFGCCCGQGGQFLWKQVCDCYDSTYTCNKTCLVSALRRENRYYQAGQELYGNVTELYPKSQIWMVGHSLGGSVSSLLGLTFGLPVVTFEGVPDALPASRLGLPVPPGYSPNTHQRRKNTGSFHFGHTADPIYMGTCNSATAACTLWGYALESQCHTGHRCVYDVVEDKNWRVSATTHSIRSVIRDVIKVYDTVPACVPDTDECFDCFNWKYFESNGSIPTTRRTTTTSPTSSTTYTRTTTCKTPGWFGCLDESTTGTHPTTTASTSLSSSTSTTVTCTHYGWFGGCLDPTTTATTISTTTTTTATPSTSTTPTTPPTTATSSVAKTSLLPTSTPTTTVCHTPGLFFGCKDKTTTATRHEITAKPPS